MSNMNDTRRPNLSENTLVLFQEIQLLITYFGKDIPDLAIIHITVGEGQSGIRNLRQNECNVDPFVELLLPKSDRVPRTHSSGMLVMKLAF